jgi:hypothetical protein
MSARNHAKIFLVVTIVWFLFLVAGLPDYYQQYAFGDMLIFVAVLLPVLWLVIYLVLKRARRGRRLTVAVWYSFYICVPLMIYDFVYCGLYLGHGLQFFAKFWYLTAYYVLPWLILPITGWWLDRAAVTRLPRRDPH